MKHYYRIFFLIIVFSLSLFMIVNPGETVESARHGFILWYSVIVPALLPFFIVAELLVNLHFVEFLGILLEPLMRPLFKLPGCSSLVVAMGFTSGFPVGALLSRRLYDKQMLTAQETERLVSFTNNSSPLFIIGALGVGMFSSPLWGYLLAASHYLANLGVGLLWGLRTIEPFPWSTKPPHRLQYAIQQLVEANKENNSLGEMLGEAIKNSLNNLIAIAGFIVFFSVLARMLTVWGVLDLLALSLCNLFSFLHLSYSLAFGMIMGLFEITIGARTVITSTLDPILARLLVVSLILAFSGFSIIAQVMSVMSGTPVRLSFYLLSRLVQMILSFAFTWAGYKLLMYKAIAVPSVSVPIYKILYGIDAWSFSLYCLGIGMAIILAMVICSLTLKD